MGIDKAKGESIFSLNVFEVVRDNDKDYHIVAAVRVGGISLEFDRTVDQIRSFFTERRERQERKRLEGDSARRNEKKGLRSVSDKERS